MDSFKEEYQSTREIQIHNIRSVGVGVEGDDDGGSAVR
jgi:hypothetical protein